MNSPRTSPIFPGVSVIDLSQHGVWQRSLIRHWTNPFNYGGTARDGAPLVWYEYVNSVGNQTVVESVTREQAARILAAELRVDRFVAALRSPAFSHVSRRNWCGRQCYVYHTDAASPTGVILAAGLPESEADAIMEQQGIVAHNGPQRGDLALDRD